jgi:hypothetical protein
MLRSDAKHRVSKHEGFNPRVFQLPVLFQARKLLKFRGLVLAFLKRPE